MLFGDVFSPYTYVPGYFSVDYVAGFYFEEGTATLPLGETSVEVEFAAPAEKTYFVLTVDDMMGATDIKVRQGGTDSFVISAKTAPTDGDVTISWVAHSVDPMILKAIGLVAALTPLDIAGDLIAGAGIAQYSVGVDGLSQSVATTASATSAGYGARIISFQNQLKTLMPALRAKYRMINTFTI